MTKRKAKPERDLEKAYSTKEFVSKLRRLANSLEQKKRFRIQISGERISVPPDAKFNIEFIRNMQASDQKPSEETKDSDSSETEENKDQGASGEDKSDQQDESQEKNYSGPKEDGSNEEYKQDDTKDKEDSKE